MIPTQFDYVVPASLGEALEQLRQNGNASLLAGGHSLLPAMIKRRAAPALLVDLRKITELTGIKASKEVLQVGAMTSFATLAADEAVQRRFSVLAEAAQSIGDPQVRNRGTVGGSLAYNDPAADLPAAALVLEAALYTAGKDGERVIPVGDFITGPFANSLQPAEVLVAVAFPFPATGAGSAYEKFRDPASGYALCGVAALVEPASDGTAARCRVAVTGAAEHAARLRKVEEAVEGRAPTPEVLAAAAAQVPSEDHLTFRTDLAASAAYRGHLTGVLVQRALARAAQRAGLNA